MKSEEVKSKIDKPLSRFVDFGRGRRTRTLTNGFGDRCATIDTIPLFVFNKKICLFGGASGTRTPDRPVMSRLL